MASTSSDGTKESDTAFIAFLEQTIEDLEYKRASDDIEAYMSVSQSLEGLLRNEKTVDHLKDFVVDERCEENVFFLLDVSEFKKIYNDDNYSISQKLLKIDKIIKQYLIPGESYSQLYIPLSIVKEFNATYTRTDELPPITLFDEIEKVVLETVRRTSYRKFVRSANIRRLLAMTVQDIKILTERGIELCLVCSTNRIILISSEKNTAECYSNPP